MKPKAWQGATDRTQLINHEPIPPDKVQQNFEYLGSVKNAGPIQTEWPPLRSTSFCSITILRLSNDHQFDKKWSYPAHFRSLIKALNSYQKLFDYFNCPEFFPVLAKCNQNVTRLLINEARSFQVYFRTHVLLLVSLKRHNLLEF